MTEVKIQDNTSDWVTDAVTYGDMDLFDAIEEINEVNKQKKRGTVINCACRMLLIATQEYWRGCGNPTERELADLLAWHGHTEKMAIDVAPLIARF